MRLRFTLALIAVLLASMAGAATIHVPGDQSTIQAAIVAASPGDTIVVSGTHNEALTINKPISLVSDSAKSLAILQGPVTITADNVTIDNFTITNPSGKFGITAIDHSHLAFTNNTIQYIGTSDATTTGTNWGIAVGSDLLSISDITIQNNTISNVVGGAGKSANGIVIGWSTGNGAITGLNIEQNIISNVISWDGTTGKGAYGVIINHGSPASGGQTQGAMIQNNTITNLEGLWVHAIGLEGVTPSAQVVGNIVGTITDHKLPSDAIGVFLEDNTAASSVRINNNSFTSVTWSIGSHPTSVTGTADASGNYFDGADPILNVAQVFGSVDYTPWLKIGDDPDPAPGFQGDHSSLGVAADSPQTGSLGRITEALGLVSGSTITLLAGTYEEQLHITTSGIQIIGSGVASTTIRSPEHLTYNFPTPGNVNYPVVFVDGVSTFSMSDLTVDGYGRGNLNYRFQGVGFWNSGGTLSNVNVVNVTDTPFSGNQHGVAVYAYNGGGGPYAVSLANVLIQGFQKNGTSLSGPNLHVDLDHVSVIGAGPTPITAQNGIQIGTGVQGTVDDCSISGIAYTGETWTATGFLIYDQIAATSVSLDGCQTSVYCIDSGSSFDHLSITNPLGDGFYAYSANTSKTNAEPVRPLPQPFDGDRSDPAKTSLNVTVANSIVIGTGLTNSWGVTAYGYDPIAFTVSNCTVENWDWGVVLYNYGDATFNAAVEHCDLAPNGTYGLYCNTDDVVQASCNWWGDISGPNVPPVNLGIGEAIAANVVFWPWLGSQGGTCNQYGNNNVAVVAPTGCLTPSSTCQTFTVQFNRADTTPLRGVSATIELSPELQLCGNINLATGANSLIGNLSHQFQVVPNVDGTYTIDVAVLGSDCGPTTGGELFTIPVAVADGAGPVTAGTVTVTDVIVRDCANGPLPGIPGVPGTVAIDLTAPAVVTNLTAVKPVPTAGPTDADGRTMITVSWTPSVSTDIAYVELWRKGFGHYPEYDDNGGAVPTEPVETPSWTSVAQIPVGTSSYADDPPVRDYWYYAIVAYDQCGNASAVSAITGGTLNYHLGDVAPASGDNWVKTPDISSLGSHYGIALVSDDPYNYLDVGPTTNNSVLGRPTTDNRVQFEDLMMFAINFIPDLKSHLPNLAPSAQNSILVKASEVDPQTGTIQVEIGMTADGQIQGLSVPLTWNGAAVKPVGFVAGDLIERQGDLGMVLSPEPGTIDAAIFGRRDRGISGEGTLAVVTFAVVGAGNPQIALGNITARDADNNDVVISGTMALPGDVMPARTALLGASPNPFNPATELSFVLAQSGKTRLGIYDVQGRLVATLVNTDLPAGPHHVTWQGQDSSGRTVASGAYIVRLEASDATCSQRITLMK